MNEPNRSLVGLDVALRQWLTPILLAAGIGFAAWSVFQATRGEKPGAVGSLLVLTIVAASGGKLAAETYLLSALGDHEGARHQAARAVVGQHSGLARARYLLGCLGGIVFPLGAQILAMGSKNIPAAENPMPAAVCAILSAVCLLFSEPLERKLFRLCETAASGR